MVRYGLVEKQAPQIRDLHHGINSLGRKLEINSKLGLLQTCGVQNSILTLTLYSVGQTDFPSHLKFHQKDPSTEPDVP